MPIQILKADVVNQIAAGEVLERPANLVKEMVENSLDAAATEIEIDISNGGRTLSIRDNGIGISPQEIELVFARHATSKIQESNDLWSLDSYGFRGEALASLAAVSRTTLISRQPETDIATRIQVEYGTLSPSEPVGGEFGTHFHVTDLFQNVPARLKFLKSDVAETSQIKRVLKALALSHIEVGFKIRENGKLTAIWPKSQTLKDRVRGVLGFENAFEALEDRGDLKCEIAFSSPNDTFGTSQNIWIFAQDRWIQDRSIQAAVMEAYRNLLMHGEFPLVVVKIQCLAETIDVNIHPTKSQVKFQNPQAIFRLVHQTLRSALEKAPWIERMKTEYQADISEALYVANQRAQSEASQPKEFRFAAGGDRRSDSSTESDIAIDAGTENSIRAGVAVQAELTDELLQRTYQRKKDFLPEEAATSSALSSDVPVVHKFSGTQITPYWSLLDVLGQANLTYILTQSRSALMLVDQHAAHERVLFERIMNAWKSSPLQAQTFLIPLTVKLEVEAVDALLAEGTSLSRLGIELERISPETLAIQSGPVFIKDGALTQAIEKLGREITQNGGGFAIDRVLAGVAATMACHSAIRAGQALSIQEMRELLQQMDEHPLSSFCPHGRPVFVEWSFRDLDRDFGRLV